MNTIELLGEEKTFKDIVEHTITEFEDSEIDIIEGYAFYDCNSLTSVSFPKATRIGQSAFQYCTSLPSVSFPLTRDIGSNAFNSCSSLPSVSFPKAKSIGTYAFQNCSNLTTIYVGTESNTVCTLKNTNAFTGCDNLTNIYVPKALVNLYKTASQWSSFASKIKAYTGV